MSAVAMGRLLSGLGLLSLLPSAALGQALSSGTPATFELPGNGLAPGLYIDVPAGAAGLRVEAEALAPGVDVDLVVRSGREFAVRGTAVDPTALFDQAQYLSVSATGDEYVLITEAGTQPLSAGRWHIGVLNFSSSASDIRLLATVLDEVPVAPIEVVFDSTSEDCDTAPWNSERRAAMERAGELLTEQLQPRVPIRVKACWFVPDEDGTLAQAGPEDLAGHDFAFGRGLPFLPERYTLYSAAAAAQNAGTDLCRFQGGDCNRFDIRANFSTSANFYYGLDNAAVGQHDFIATAMHEITHGLGFYGLVDADTGALRVEYADPYTANVKYHKSGVAAPIPLYDLDDAGRLEALTSRFNLRISGENVLLQPGFPLRLYAPPQPNPGSTFSHLDSGTFGSDLMAPAIPPGPRRQELGYALPILYDAGWDPAPKTAPTFTVPDNGQYYDPRRSGHGVAMYRLAGLEEFYFVVFYTYDQAGKPEFYVSAGHVVDGVFVPERNEYGDDLIRSYYREGQVPPTAPETAASFEGRIRIDFNQPTASRACTGLGDRLGDTVAVMSFVLPGNAGNEFHQWCLQPLVGDVSLQNDLSNIWYNTSDTGWGVSGLSFAGASGDGLVLQLYYPDAQGNPRWAAIEPQSYAAPGGTYPLLQPSGYCRSCPLQPITFEEVGTVTVGLTSASGQGGALPASTLDFTVSYDGVEGGTFERDTEVAPGGPPNQ